MDRYVNSCLCGPVGGPYEAVLIYHPALESTWATLILFVSSFASDSRNRQNLS